MIQIAGDLRSRGISLAFAHLDRSILDLWTRADAIQAIGPDHVFESVRAAVQALDATPAATAAPTSGAGSPRSTHADRVSGGIIPTG